MSFLTERLFQVLDQHRLYELITSPVALQHFMERHVVCAWSYNALLRSLQRDLVAMSLPLNSDSHKEALRLISEIILDEEVEDLGDGRFLSHMELYIEAMQDVGCDVAPVLGFFDLLETRLDPEKAIEYSEFSDEAKDYARNTVEILAKPLHCRAAALFYEGESFIPDFFLLQVDELNGHVAADRFLDYMERHIEGLKRPGFSAAGRLVEVLCGDDPTLNREAEKVAEYVMRARIALWNRMVESIQAMPPQSITRIPVGRHLRLIT